MTEAEIRKTTDAMMERVVDLFNSGQIGICQAAERTLLIDRWAADRRETAGLVRELEEVSGGE